MNYPSLNIAGRHIGAHPNTLTTQIQRLEHDIGAPLINRGTVTTPMTPTERGTALLETLHRPDVHALIDQHGKPPRGRKPDDPRRTTTRRSRPTTRQPAKRRTITHSAPKPTAESSRTPSTVPEDLGRLIRGRNGWERLQRFATAMTYPTLTEAAAALGITISTLVEQLHRLETDVGAPLFHRATPASQAQRPTRRGAMLLHTLARPDIQALQPPGHRCVQAVAEPGGPRPAAPPAVLPLDLLHAVQGQRSGWTRLERFATTMTHPTIGEAAAAIGVNRTTLLEQLHRLETDVGARLYHRATADGEPQQPTHRGTGLLETLAQPDIEPLRVARIRLARVPAISTAGKARHLALQPHVVRVTC